LLRGLGGNSPRVFGVRNFSRGALREFKQYESGTALCRLEHGCYKYSGCHHRFHSRRYSSGDERGLRRWRQIHEHPCPRTPARRPAIAVPLLATNGFQFQFAGEWNANYTIQYTTNPAAPVTWQTLQTIIWNLDNVVQITDSKLTDAARFYRVLAQ
jgi:hypothetical protein